MSHEKPVSPKRFEDFLGELAKPKQGDRESLPLEEGRLGERYVELGLRVHVHFSVGADPLEYCAFFYGANRLHGDWRDHLSEAEEWSKVGANPGLYRFTEFEVNGVDCHRDRQQFPVLIVVAGVNKGVETF